MNKKLLFIIPPTLNMGKVAKIMRVQNATIPYGVLSIATYVRKYCRLAPEIKIIDMNVKDYSDMNDDIATSTVASEASTFAPDIIGISLMYNHMYKYTSSIPFELRKTLSEKTIIVAGGCCIMAYFDKILNDSPCLDAICFSEGEIPLVDLLDANNPHAVLESHPSWATAQTLSSGKTFVPSFVENLDDIPPIDFDLIDLRLYGTHRTSFRPVKKENEFCLPITTTRGCPYNCVFCIAGSLHGKRVRRMSAKRVISDVKQMIDKYAMNVLSIEDDQFLSDIKRSKSILRGLADFNISLIADSGFTVKLLDDETAILLSEAGLQTAVLAIESGSEFVLKEIIDKPIKLEQVPPAIESIRRAGMYCHAFLVTGFPGETDKHRDETIDFIKKTCIDWCYITCATPIRGSRLYNICVAKNYINPEDHTENAFYVSSINTPEYSAKYVSRAAYLMNLELNFVNNYRLRIKDYKTLAIYMEHVLSKYPQHAFAQYFAAVAYEGLGKSTKARECRQLYSGILAKSEEWRGYARHFRMPKSL